MAATPRITYQDLPRELQARLQPRVKRLGYLGEFFQVAAHQPEALLHFIDFTEALKEALDTRLVEVIALSVASEAGNDYERAQHERLALKIGMHPEEVRGLVEGSLPATRFSEMERAAAELARDVVRAQGQASRGYEALESLAGATVAVGCLMTAARYLAHATMANTWGVRAPVDSPLEELRRV